MCLGHLAYLNLAILDRDKRSLPLTRAQDVEGKGWRYPYEELMSVAERASLRPKFAPRAWRPRKATMSPFASTSSHLSSANVDWGTGQGLLGSRLKASYHVTLGGWEYWDLANIL